MFGLYPPCKTSNIWHILRWEFSRMAWSFCFLWQLEYQMDHSMMMGGGQLRDTKVRKTSTDYSLSLYCMSFLAAAAAAFLLDSSSSWDWFCSVMSCGYSLVTPVRGVTLGVVWSLLPLRSFKCRCFPWNQLIKYSCNWSRLHNQVVNGLDLCE